MVDRYIDTAAGKPVEMLLNAFERLVTPNTTLHWSNDKELPFC